MQGVYLQRHHTAGRLHDPKEVHGEQDQLHGGDQCAALKQAHRPSLGVLPQLRKMLAPVVCPAFLVQRLVRRIGIEIDVQIRLYVRLRHRMDIPCAVRCHITHRFLLSRRSAVCSP